MERANSKRPMISWALYDWANSAFATTVMAGFFPVFFKSYWYSDAEATQSTFALGMGNAIAGLVIAVMAPVLGAIADRGSAKRRFLFTMVFLGVVSTAALFFIAEGQYLLALFVYVVAVIGFESATTFYDSLIVSVSDEKSRVSVSALGYSLGYLGGGVLFTLNVLMALNPEWFGLADDAAAVRVSFLTVAVWWTLFTIPLYLWVKEPRDPHAVSGMVAVRGGIQQLAQTIKEVGSLKVVATFLVAYWLYMDGVHTIVRMAVDYGLALGFPSDSLIKALLITQFVGFPATLVMGKLASRIGAKPAIYVCITVYAFVTVWGFFMTQIWQFYALAVIIGLAQGGSQAISRAYYISMVPQARIAQFCGFYNMLGKFAAVLGPVLVGVVAAVSGSNRLSILSLLILFAGGAFVLYFVDPPRGERHSVTPAS
ncbi:MAG: MFS transporter [Candidatus Hydrogenedentota bacterium]